MQYSAGTEGADSGVHEHLPEVMESKARAALGDIYSAVIAANGHNFRAARVPVPSGLCVADWRRYLEGYPDRKLPDLLEFGWPVNCDLGAVLQPTGINHPSARHFSEDVEFYIRTELFFGALGGPNEGTPFVYIQTSPLMTRPKKGVPA